MSDPSHVTHDEIERIIQLMEEKFKSADRKTLLYIAVAAGLVKFNAPDPVTLAAGGVAALKLGLAVFHRQLS